MWPDPTDARTAIELPKHAGLGHKDRRILDEMFQDEILRPDRFWLNQVVGTLPTWTDEIRDPTHRAWIEATYSKRPDLIAQIEGALYAVEIKPYASYQALGQALMYAELAEAKTDPHRPVEPMILTDVPDPDLLRVLPSVRRILIRQLGRFTLPRPSFPT